MDKRIEAVGTSIRTEAHFVRSVNCRAPGWNRLVDHGNVSTIEGSGAPVNRQNTEQFKTAPAISVGWIGDVLNIWLVGSEDVECSLWVWNRGVLGTSA